MSTGDEPTTTHRGPSGARPGVPSWAHDVPAGKPSSVPGVPAALRALEAEGWLVLHALHHPGRPSARIAHVAVGPGGVVVVEGTGRTAGAHQGTDAAAAVAALLAPRFRTAVRGVRCGPGRGTADAPVVRATALGAHLRALPPRLSPVDAAGLALLLEVRLGGAGQPDLLTTADLTDDARVARRRAVRPRRSVRCAPPAPQVATPWVVAGRRAATAAVVLAAGWLAWVAVSAPLAIA
ncbi:hypothetical protein J1G42_02570 [Cellulomonas sp. zg-ZUI222]|uniref:hypothetical protein n=1 Tax=Cellulomonas wangleii TaxID=2816956 RepID=UPI001A949EC9|nr:hypothetical protein [Cellulomonas wangleii]MBO0919708.1 hypothetical protein [Cellulomonas wangleii]